MATQPANRPELLNENLNTGLLSLVKQGYQTVEQLLEMPVTDPPSLPEKWMARTKISSWPLASLVIGALFYGWFLVSAYLDGFAAAALVENGDNWLHSLIPPAMLIYLLLIIPLLRRLLTRTIATFQSMIPYNDRFKRLELEAYSLSRRREWFAIVAGTLVGWLILRPPWDLSHLSALIYDLIGDLLIFGLMGWHIYAALARTKLLTDMHGQVQNLNLFKQSAPVKPLIQWSLGVVACLLGAIGVSILLLPQDKLMTPTSIVVYSSLGLAALLVIIFSRVPTSLLGQLRVFRALMLFVVVAIVGTIGYNRLEGWNAPEAFYATIITMTTIGYGDFSPTSIEGRIFTIVLSLFAIGIGGYAVTSIASFVIEGNFHRYIQGKKVDKQIVQMKDHYILCGAGQLGKQIAIEFYKSQVPFVVIEQSSTVLEELLRELEIPYVQGDATQDEALRLAGVERATGLVAALSDDKDNVFIVLSARSFNPKLRIISRLSVSKNRKKLKKAGANVVISPNAVSGRRMVSEMLHSEVVTFLDEMLRAEQQTGQTLRLEELHVNDIKVPVLVERLNQSELTITDIGQRTELMVVAIKRDGLNSQDRYIYTPRGNTTLNRGDVLLVIATPEQRLKLQQHVLSQNNFDLLLSKVFG